MLIDLQIKYRYSHTTPVKGVSHYLVKYECPTQTNKYCLTSPWDKDCIGHLFYVPVETYNQQLTTQEREDTLKS